MPYFLVQTGNGYVYQIFASDAAAAQAKARSQAPAGGSFGGTDISSTTVVSGASSVPFQGYRDETGVEPSGSTAGPGDPPGAALGTGNVTAGLENTPAFRRGAFQRGLQRQGQNPEGFLGGYLNDLYEPLTGAFDLLEGGRSGSDPENAFQNYVASTPVGSVRGRATEAFRSVFNPSAAPNQGAQIARNQYADPYGQQGGEFNQDIITNLIALAQQAAASKYSPDIVRRLLPTSGQIQSRFQRGGLASPFRDFLQNQYGLSGGGF